MIDKIKKIFENKEKRIENLISLLIILVITLIVINKIIKDNLYGAKESLAIEYFYSLLYNISCCANIAQYEQLYKYIIDNRLFGLSKKRENALTILNFIEEFTPELRKVQQTAFLPGLKQKINAKFKEAQEVIQMSNCPD